MNNKGFTLVEVLVVMSISALILMIALPSITKLSSSNKETKKKQYESSIIAGAKLYVESKEIDLNWNGNTTTITFNTLKTNNYVKTNKGCNTNNVTITVTKNISTNKKTYVVNNLSCS